MSRFYGAVVVIAQRDSEFNCFFFSRAAAEYVLQLAMFARRRHCPSSSNVTTLRESSAASLFKPELKPFLFMRSYSRASQSVLYTLRR